MSNYQDRGMIKWMPFDALTGFGDMIHALTHAHKRVEVPFLFEDTLSVFEYTIKEAHQNQQMMHITFISNQRKKEAQGYIRALDLRHKRITLSSGDVIDVSTIIHMMI